MTLQGKRLDHTPSPLCTATASTIRVVRTSTWAISQMGGTFPLVSVVALCLGPVGCCYLCSSTNLTLRRRRPLGFPFYFSWSPSILRQVVSIMLLVFRIQVSFLIIRWQLLAIILVHTMLISVDFTILEDTAGRGEHPETLPIGCRWISEGSL